ncbi:type II toxin-antitoxin system VapB family antitoxin [Lunatimonas salinarum]
MVDFLKSKSVSKSKNKPQRKPGLAKGLIRMKDDFDEPLDDFKEYM